MFKFKHLKDVNMTYTYHLKESMIYSFKALQSSYYFFIHGFYPDVYKCNGSENIKNLLLQIKLRNYINIKQEKTHKKITSDKNPCS